MKFPILKKSRIASASISQIADPILQKRFRPRLTSYQGYDTVCLSVVKDSIGLISEPHLKTLYSGPLPDSDFRWGKGGGGGGGAFAMALTCNNSIILS